MRPSLQLLKLIFFVSLTSTHMPVTCIHCSRTFAGPSGLHYHKITQHGYLPRNHKKNKKVQQPRKKPPVAPKKQPAPVETPPNTQKEKLIIVKNGLCFKILSCREDDIRYASRLSDLEVEIGVYDTIWQDEHYVPHMPERQHGSLYGFGV